MIKSQVFLAFFIAVYIRHIVTTLVLLPPSPRVFVFQVAKISKLACNFEPKFKVVPGFSCCTQKL